MSVRAARWAIAGEWRAHPARVAVAMLAIAIGVALGFAVHLVNASALDRFARGLATVNGRADLRIEAARAGGLPDASYPAAARVAGVAAASPVVSLDATLAGAKVALLGIDALRVAAVAPALLPKPAGDPERVFDPQAVFLSAAARGPRRIGEAVTISAGGHAARFAIAGTLPAATTPVAVIDIAAAQQRFGRIGRLDRIDLKLADGADAVRARLAPLLPAGATIAAPADDATQSDALSRAYRVNLDMLALVALLTGAFLVYSAQALSVARRGREFALMRTLGATRRLVLGQVLAEGAVLGLVGSALGIALGLGVAAAVLRLVGGDLGSGAFAGEGTPPLVFAPGAALAFAALGLAAALAGSWLPARAAARLAPAIALKQAGDPIDPRARPAIWPALALAVAGIGAALLPALGGLPIAGYAAVGLLLAAGIAAMPWVARALLAPLARRRFRAPAVELAVRRLWGAPGQAAVALSGIVASLGLMVAMAVMVASFRGSVDEWLGQILASDLYMTLPDPALAPADQARLARVPGVAHVAFALQRPLRIARDKPAAMLLVRHDPAAIFPHVGGSAGAAPGTVPVWLSEPAASIFRLAPGDRLTLSFGAATVSGVLRDYARPQGMIAIRADDYTRLTGDTQRGEAAFDLVPGADPGAVEAHVRSALPPPVRAAAQIVPVAALRARALAIFDRSFAITYGLEAVAVAVGLAGVAATVSAQTIARTREFGMLRHLGVTRAQVVATLGVEGALIGAVGAAAGIALGLGVAQVLIHVVNPQSFGWTMTTRLPLPLLAGVALALIVAACLTAMVAGRRAVSIDAVRAVREDW